MIDMDLLSHSFSLEFFFHPKSIVVTQKDCTTQMLKEFTYMFNVMLQLFL
jgi:hypothetical protein